MQENRYKDNEELWDNELDLRKLFQVLLEGKWIISIFLTIASVSAIIYSLALPNVYQSKALLVPTQSRDMISSTLGNYSNLASLAGLNLSSQTEGNITTQSIHKINSLSFFEDYILPNIFLPELMAVKSWDAKNNILTLDEDLFDKSSNTWIRESSFPKKSTPSSQESFNKFKSEHLVIEEDKKTGFVSLAIKHQSPHVAKNWAELVIEQINSYYREKDKEDAQKSESFLKEQFTKTNFTEIKQVIANLLQQQTQKLTLIEVNEFYVFSYIDPPALMEEKFGPNRAIICVLAAIFGFIFSIFFILIKHYGFRR